MQLTVVVCTYRRFEWLAKCIQALERQTLPCEEFKILVVDTSLAPDDSARIRDSLGHIRNLEYVITGESGLSSARNLAWKKCDTPYIAYIDDDAIAAPDWAEEIVRGFEMRSGAGAIGGKVDPIWEVEPPAWLQGDLKPQLSLLDWGEGVIPIFRGAESRWLVGTNLAYRTSALRSVGGFPEALGRGGNSAAVGAEHAVNVAVESLGYDVLYFPTIRVNHLVQRERVTVDWLLKNSFYEGASRELFENSGGEIELERLSRALDQRFQVLASRPLPKEITDDVLDRCRGLAKEGRKLAAALIEESNPSEQTGGRAARSVIFVVTPSLNAADTIDQTILSVVSQAGDFAIRYHVQDGGSTDDTIKQLAQWSKRLASGDFPIACNNVVFTYTSGPDSGMYAAIAAGFATMAIPQYAYMTWINADDLLIQSAFATVLGANRDIEEDSRWIGQSPAVINGRGELIHLSGNRYPRAVVAAGICDGELWPTVQQEGSFWKKELWDKVGGLNLELNRAGDWDLWRRFAQDADLLLVPWMFGIFRKRPGQMSTEDRGRRYREELDAIISPEDRRAGLERLAASGSGTLKTPVLDVDYSTERYSIKWEPLDSQMPTHARRLFELAGTTPLSEAPVASGAPELPPVPSNAQVLEPKPVPQRTVIGSDKSRKLYSISPAWMQRIYRVVKFSALLPLLDFTRSWRMKRTIRRSGLFHASYYLGQHPDVGKDRLNPIDHYLRYGFNAGYDPNPLFDSAWYLSMNPALLEIAINPLYHYIRVGAKQGQDPGPYFSVADYCAKYPGLDIAKQNPLLHYYCVGVLDGCLQTKSAR